MGKIEDFINLEETVKELSLITLKKLDTKLKTIYKENDYSDNSLNIIDTIETMLIPKYEKLFLEFNILNIKSEEIDDNKIDNIKNIINNIMIDGKISEEFLYEEIKKRKKYYGNSGADVVKNLYEMQLKELINSKEKIMNKILELENKERTLYSDLSNVVQHEEELEISSKLIEVREQIQEIDESLSDISDKVNDLQNNLDSKWRYEIYGTISKDDLRKSLSENNI